MASDALHQLGRDIAFAALGAIRTLETHGPANQALATALDRLVALAGSASSLIGGELLRLDIIDGRLLINGDRLRAHGTAQEAFDQLVEQFADRRLGGIAFSSAPTVETLRRWLSVFVRRPDTEEGFAALHTELAALQETGVVALEMRSVLEVEQEDAVEVSTMAFAMQAYARALLGFRDFVRASKEGRDPYQNRLDVVKVMQDLIDVVSARSDLILQVIHVAQSKPLGRSYAELHAASSAVYAAMIGHVLRFDRTSLLDLATATLLSDVVGALREGDASAEASEWSSEDRAAGRADLAGAVRAILATGELDEAMMIRAIIAEEYTSSDHAALHPFSRIAAVATVYDALTQRRPWRPAKHPVDALMVLRKDARFDPTMVLALECVLAGYLGIATAEQAEF